MTDKNLQQTRLLNPYNIYNIYVYNIYNIYQSGFWSLSGVFLDILPVFRCV